MYLITVLSEDQLAAKRTHFPTNVPKCVRMCQNVPECFRMCQSVSECAKMCQNVLYNVSKQSLCFDSVFCVGCKHGQS